MNVIKQIVGSGKYGEQTIKMIVKDNERGPQGEKGETGAAATIAAGNAYSTPSGSAPAVINTGTSSNAVFDFYIPKGDKGEKGETGATGARGPQGPQGPQGVQGLQGPQGPAGKNGKDGKDGTDGKDGAIQYTAGANVNISSQNVISATDTTYSNFTGTDGTSAGASGLVPAPATTDAGKFLKADGTWDTAGGGATYTAGDGIDITNDVISATNTGKARVLTTDDYNWPTDNPSRVALWLLDPGFYIIPDSTSLAIDYGAGEGYATGTRAESYLVGETKTTGDYRKWVLSFPSSYNGIRVFRYTNSSGNGSMIWVGSPVDNLTSTSTASALSANQGKVLNDKIEGRVITGAGAPATSTVGTVGMVYEDTTNGKLYICTAIVPGTDPDPDTYTWEEVGGASGPTVVQTTGTSTTDVMSQNAVTSMVYADPSTKHKVQIGTGSNASGNYSTALGRQANANANNSVAIGHAADVNSSQNAVALGYGAKVTRNGEVNIGAGFAQGSGYNSSDYRVLGGLYDPQSAHDAATKNYVDTVTPTITMQTTDPGEGSALAANNFIAVYNAS